MTEQVGDLEGRIGLEDEMGPGLDALAKKVEEFSEKLDKTLSESTQHASENLEKTHGAFEKLFEGVEIGAGIELFNTLKEKVFEVGEYFLGAAEHVGEMSEHLEILKARTGIATDSLDVLAKVGKIADVSVDSMGMSLNRMQKAVESGSKSATEALARMHTTLGEFRQLKPEEQFQAMLDGLEKIPEGAQRTNTMMQLLGRGGLNMAPLVGHVKELKDRLHELGVTMSGENIAAASAFDDKMDILEIVMDSFREKIGTAVATTPALGAALDQLTNGLAALGKILEENSGTIQSWVTAGIGLIQQMATEGWAVLKPAIEEVKVALEDMWARMGGGAGIMETLTGIVVGLIKAFAEIVPLVTSVVSWFLQLDTSTKVVIASMALLIQMGGGVGAVFTNLLVPAFNSTAVAFADFAFWMAGAETITIPGIIAGFGLMAAAVTATGVAALEFGSVLVNTGNEMRGVNDPIAMGVEKVGALTGAWVIAKDAAGGLASFVKDTLATAFTFWSDEGSKASGVLKIAFEVVNATAMPLKVTFEALAVAASYFSEKLDGLSAALYKVNPSGQQLDRMQADIIKATQLSGKFVGTWEEAAVIIGKAGKAMQDARGIGVDWSKPGAPGKPGEGAPPPLPPIANKEAEKALEAYHKELEKLNDEFTKAGASGLNAYEKMRDGAQQAYSAEMNHIAAMKNLSEAQKGELQTAADRVRAMKEAQADIAQETDQTNLFRANLLSVAEGYQKLADAGKSSWDKQRDAANAALSAQISKEIEATIAGKQNAEQAQVSIQQFINLKNATLASIGSAEQSSQLRTFTGDMDSLNERLRTGAEAADEFGSGASHSFDDAMTKIAQWSQQAAKAVIQKQMAHQIDMAQMTEELTRINQIRQQEEALAEARERNNARLKESLGISLEQMGDIIGLGREIQNVLSAIGISSDSMGAKLVGAFTSGLEAAMRFAQAQTAIQKAQAILGAAADAWKTGADKGAAAGATQGAMSGAAIGAMMGGPIGAAAGAVGGALIGALGSIFGKPEWKKVGEAAGKILGESIGDETAKALTETMHDAGVSMENAILLNLDRIMADTGKTIQDMSGQVLQLINTKFAAGSVAAKQQADQISKAWQEVRNTATQVGDAMTVAMLKSAEAAGTMTSEMKDFIKAQQDLGASGAKKIAEGLAMIKPEDLKKFENFGPVAADFFTKGFQDAIDKEGLVAALDDFGDSLTDVYKQMQETFPTQSSSAILAPFINLKNVLDEDDGTLKGMITTLEGMGDVAESQANRGLFDPSMQASMGDALSQTFEQLKTKTGDAKVSMQAILPELTKQIQASQQLGVPLDENTARLKEQAEAMHFAFPAEPIIQLVDLMKTLVTGLGFALPKSAEAAGRAIDTVGKVGADSLETATADVIALGTTATASFQQTSEDVKASITDTLGQSQAAMDTIAQSGIDSSDTVSTAWNGTVSKIGMFVEEAVAPVSGAFQDLSDESSAPLDALLAKLNGVARAAGAIGANANASQGALINLGETPINGGETKGGGPEPPQYDEGGTFTAGIGKLPRGGTAYVAHPGEIVRVTTAGEAGRGGGMGPQIHINYNPNIVTHGAGNDAEIIRTVKHHLVNDQKGLRQVIKRYAGKGN